MKVYDTQPRKIARIRGIGVVTLANLDERMTLHESINAKSWMPGAGWSRCRQFIRLCRIRIESYKQSPNRTGYLHPQCF